MLRWIDELVLRDELLEDVVLQRAGEPLAWDTVLLGDDDQQREQHGRGAVDRHRRRQLVERQSVKEQAHVGERIDGDTTAAELALRPWVVVVVTHERRHVEGDREAVVTGGQQLAVAAVGLFDTPEAAEHADRPRLAAVAGAVDAAGVRIRARYIDVALVLDASSVGGVVEALDGAT